MEREALSRLETVMLGENRLTAQVRITRHLSGAWLVFLRSRDGVRSIHRTSVQVHTGCRILGAPPRSARLESRRRPAQSGSPGRLDCATHTRANVDSALPNGFAQCRPARANAMPPRRPDLPLTLAEIGPTRPGRR